MTYTPQMIEKAKNAQSPEDLMRVAKEEQIELDVEEAKRIFDKFHATSELDDDEIDSVSGGGCNDPSTPSFQGTWVSGYELSTACPICHNNCWAETGFAGNGPRNYQCYVCYTRKRHGCASAPSVVPMTQECGHPNTKNRTQVWVD